MIRKALAISVTAGLIAAMPAGAVDVEDPRPDVEQYALSVGVSNQEAALQLRLQDEVAALRVAIEARAESTFGGLYIDHVPDYRIVVQYTGANADSISPFVSGSPLRDLVALEKVEFTQAQLDEDIAKVGAALSGGLFSAYVDGIRNRVILEGLSNDSVLTLVKERGLTLPASVEIEVVPELPRPALDLYGGLHLSGCTAGFTIYKSTTTNRMITTAGHCSNTQSYGVNSLTYQNDEVRAGGQDIQSHKRAGALYPNRIKYTASGATRAITGEITRGQSNIGDWTCHYGLATGYGCGYIVSVGALACGGSDTHYDAIKVDSDPNGPGFDLSEGGDSGGPWFLNSDARGTMSCQQGFDAIYVAIDTSENGLGAYLLVTP